MSDHILHKRPQRQVGEGEIYPLFSYQQYVEAA
jgi:hypothetical protein